MIKIIPSIAVARGKTTRTTYGKKLTDAVYDVNPLDVAKTFEDYGIKQVHMVDLDGARRGEPKNYATLEIIAGHTNLEIDFSGGIQQDCDIYTAYEHGATYITAASVAVMKRELFASWLISYGREKITLGADALNRKIAIKGWWKDTTIDVLEHIAFFHSRGIKFVKCTDIQKEGTLQGPSFELYQEILNHFPDLCLVASGGIRNVEDIERLNDIGVWGAHFGKAYYEGRIQLRDLKHLLS